MTWFLPRILGLGIIGAVAWAIYSWVGREPSTASIATASGLERLADSTGAHSDDPGRPRAVAGVSDAEIAEMNPGAASLVVEQCFDLAVSEVTRNPRLLFQVARIGLIALEDDEMIPALELAARHGSGISAAYLSALYAGEERERYERLAQTKGFSGAKKVQAEWERRREASAFRLAESLRSLAMHPDLRTSTDGPGVSDDELAAREREVLQAVLQEGLSLTDRLQPRSLFELGRVARAAGDFDTAHALYEVAAPDIPIAHAALGEIAPLAESIGHYARAAAAGFKPAAEWRDRRLRNEFADYHAAALLRAFAECDRSYLSRNAVFAAVYVHGFHKIVGEMQVVFLTSDTRVLLELDPKLPGKILLSMVKDPSRWGGMAEQLLPFFSDKLSSPSGSAVELMSIANQARLDVCRMVAHYENDPTLLRAVYAGMKDFFSGPTSP